MQSMLVLMGAGACSALWLSELPAAVAGFLAPAVMLLVTRRLLLERGAAERSLLIDRAGRVILDGRVLDGASFQWRGPVAILVWSSGRRSVQLLWWPDVLTSSQRRELRLAVSSMSARPQTHSVAP